MRILQRIGILVCLFPTLSAFGQETDSLRTLLTKAPPDTARVSLLAETSIAYQAVNGDSSLIFAEEGIALATKLKFAYGHARCLFCKGVAYDIKGETEKAIAIITAAREEFRQIGDSTGVAATTQSMGVAWFYGGDQNKSLAAYTEALSMFERLGQDKNVSRTLNNIAIIYRNQQKYEQAIEIYNKAIRVKEKLNDLDGIAATHMNLGIAYSYLKDEEKAESFIRKAMVHYSATGNLRELNSCKAALGVSLLNQKKYAEAETMLEASMGPDLDPQLLPIHLLSLAKAEIPMKKFGEAAVHAREALMALGNEENMEIRKQITLEIAVAEAGLGQFESAYRSMLVYDSLSTVVLSAERMKEIELLEKKFETKEKDKDL
ncbi:MAG: tetratricopeptide repeat protein, partial [Flavobacteriales bacterium]|nr:tetratricopeptide repeat protein [Flavobacteriales bacterium]